MKAKYLLASVAIALVFGCQTGPDRIPAGNNGLETVVLRLSPYLGDPLETRTTYSYDATANEFHFLWSEGDAVGIVSSEGNQLKFPVKEEYYGQNEAVFDGRGFALLSGSRYASYRPFIADYDLDPSAVPVHYDGQSQKGDDNTDGLGTYGYSAAIGTAPSAGRLDFLYLNIGSPHRYRMPVLPASFEKLTVSVDEPLFVLKGTFNLNADDDDSMRAISPTEMSDRIELDLSGTTMEAVGNLRCWMMVAPVDLTGKVIRMTLKLADGSSLIAAVPGANCPVNYRKLFSAKTSVYPEETSVACEGGAVSIQLINSATPATVTFASNDEWITETGSSTEGRVTTYSFTVSENTGAAREGSITFTETDTGIANTVRILQRKAGTIIGIGGWETDSHQGSAQ